MDNNKINNKKSNPIISLFSYIITFFYWIVMGIYKILIKNLKYPIIGIYYYLKQILIIILYALKGLWVIYEKIARPLIKLLKKIITSVANNIEKSREKSRIRKENSASAKRKKEQLELERKQLLTSLENDEERSEEALVYQFKARSEQGKMETGRMRATSKQDVMSYLVNENYTVYSIKTSSAINFVYGHSSIFKQKMKNKELIFWLAQLSTYVKSGIPLVEAVRILGKQMSKQKSRKKLFDAISYELMMGNPFSEALARQKDVFPTLLINMLKAAEATGDLEGTLDEMTQYYTDVENTRKEMISAMTYPAIITVFALGVITFIALFIVPQFVGIYESLDVDVNIMTQAIINVSVFLQANIIYMALIIITLIVALSISYKKIKMVRYSIQYALMHVPIVKQVIMYNELTIFTKTFASLLKNNVYITDSMNILSKITNNEIYRSIIITTMANIYRGDKISLSFKDHWAIPDVAYFMIVTGESTGELPAMMGKVSDYYQSEHKNIIAKLKAFIEPAMIIFLAGTVGTVIIAIIIPMFQLYGQIS